METNRPARRIRKAAVTKRANDPRPVLKRSVIGLIVLLVAQHFSSALWAYELADPSVALTYQQRDAAPVLDEPAPEEQLPAVRRASEGAFGGMLASAGRAKIKQTRRREMQPGDTLLDRVCLAFGRLLSWSPYLLLGLLFTGAPAWGASPTRRPTPVNRSADGRSGLAPTGLTEQASQVLADDGGADPVFVAKRNGPRYAPWGNGNIVIADPAEDPYLPIFENAEPGSLMDRGRPNLFDIPVTDDWDFYNLVNTDRPDFTDATYSVGKGVTIIETGYTYRAIDEGDTTLSRRTLPETLVRLGLTDEFELRMKWFGYVMTDQHDIDTGARVQKFGGDDLILGFKHEVAQQNLWLPMVTWVSTATVPTGTNGVSAHAVQPSLNLVWGWGIRRWLYLKMSTGADWLKTPNTTFVANATIPSGVSIVTSRDALVVYHNSVSMLYQATPRIGGFAEWFCLNNFGAEDTNAMHYLDTGLFIYATTNVQFDVRIGTRVASPVDDLFTGAGLSLRY